METTAVKLYSTGYREAKTYLAAALFVAGNIVLPQICHLVPQGGLRWLPIYFFTLVGAYKYGWRVAFPSGRYFKVSGKLQHTHFADGMQSLFARPGVISDSWMIVGMW